MKASFSGPRFCRMKARSTETMILVSSVSRKTMKKTAEPVSLSPHSRKGVMSVANGGSYQGWRRRWVPLYVCDRLQTAATASVVSGEQTGKDFF